MFKRLLSIFALLLILPAHAGELESALNDYDKVFVYFYSDTCGACKRVAPAYRKLYSNYSRKCKFVKVNASTKYGFKHLRSLGISYVPFMLMVDTKKQQKTILSQSCIFDSSCSARVMNKFLYN